MTDQARNMRTLIVCFVIAIMVLIPLRFVEVGNSLIEQRNESVLGEVDLPEAGGPKLEQPYEEIEAQSDECMKSETAHARIEEITNRMMAEDLSQEEARQLTDELVGIEGKICQ